jgi:ubiquitin-protein ligase
MELDFLDSNSLYELNDISIQSIKKRIIKELVLLFENSLIPTVNVDHDKNVTIITVEDKQYVSFNIYSFIISSSYPFSPPNIFINSIPYINFFKINTIGFCKNLQKVSKIYCFCCNTIIHSSKWSPTIKIYDIIMEIRRFKKIRRDAINKILLDVITRKYLIKDICLYSWLF